jgi:signal peptidase I
MTDDDRVPESSADSVEPVVGQFGDSNPAIAAPARPHSGVHRSERPARSGSFFRELPVLLLAAFVLALLIKAFLIQAFYIPSGSMERTLLIKDRVLVNKVVYRIRDVHRGEVVVFKGPDTWAPEVITAPAGNGLHQVLVGLARTIGVGPPGEKDFIKRVIGLPGDTVACCTNGHVTVQSPGHPAVELAEPYIYENNPGPERAFAPVTVPAGRLWVMGDHRGASADSRAHMADLYLGTVPAANVIGRAFVRVWPLDRVGSLPVPRTFAPLAAGGLEVVPYALGAALVFPLAGVRRRRRLTRDRSPADRPVAATPAGQASSDRAAS